MLLKLMIIFGIVGVLSYILYHTTSDKFMFVSASLAFYIAIIGEAISACMFVWNLNL